MALTAVLAGLALAADGAWAARPYTARVTSDEIREQFQSFFEARDHLRQPSASADPAQRSLDAAHQRGHAPAQAVLHRPRAAAAPSGSPRCQKCFRTPDIDEVGITKRHLTFFEMLGNFSFGDYFKQGAVEMAWEFSLEHLGFDPERIWITVFEGDDELGLGPDEEAIEAWLSVGVPRERIVLLPRSENFWQAGSTGPVRPVLGALLRPRARLRHRDRPPRRRQRALPRVLEPRLHAVRPGARGRPDPAAGQEHRHRPRTRADGGHPAGHRLGVRDRQLQAADRARRAAQRPHATTRTTTPTARCASSPTTRAACRS